jgi:hypothetical protein
MVRHIAWMCMILAATAAAQAQEAQRLQYRTDGQPERSLGVYAEARLRAETSPPAGVALPKFSGDRPLFAKWITPRVPAGHLWLALDQSAKQGVYDRLYVDTNADGSLADETPVAAEAPVAAAAVRPAKTAPRATETVPAAPETAAPPRARPAVEEQTARFPTFKVLFPAKNGPIAYHLNVTFRSRIQRIITWTRGVPDRESLVEELWLMPGGWHEGTVTVGGKTYLCRLADANVNGTFDDVSADEGQADFILIDGDARMPLVRTAGRYIQIGGALYHPAPARDGASITFTLAKDVPTGTLRLDVPQAQLTVGGENGLLYLSATEGKVSAPAGKYRLTTWKIEKADDSGATWRAEGSVVPNETSILEVREGKETPLAIGEPFTCKGTDTAQDRGTHSLGLRLRGRLDEPVYLYRNGQFAPPPQVRIANADKTYDQAFATEYG